MRRITALIAIVVISVFAQALGGPRPQTDPLSSQEHRGREIYFGTAASPPIRALIGDPPAEAPGALMACANCHGQDGKGKPEGGVVPSDITWEALTKPYIVTHPSGRTHPRYTERLLVRAVCMGIDPAGNKLHVAMPRFQMSREDINALIAYLKRFGRDVDPGLSDSTIKLGTVLPTTGPLAEAGRAIKAVLLAYVDDVNKQGGIFNRKLELSIAELGGSPAESAANVEKLIKEERPFALVAALTAGAEKEIVAACERSQVPLVGPLTVFAETGYPANRQTFYLLSGVEQQARALIDYSRRSLKGNSPRIAIVYSQAVGSQIVEAIQRYCKQSGLEAVIAIDGQSAGFGSIGLEQKVRSADAELTLLLASGREAGLLAKAAEKTGWMPVLLIPGSLATSDLLDLRGGLEKRIFLALPSLPSDQTQAGASEYRALADTYHLPVTEIASQITALCSVKVLAQGLKLAGRALTRERLVTALEGLNDFDTGLMPRIGFGPDRRIGALGAYIVTVDSDKKQFRPVSGWLRLD